MLKLIAIAAFAFSGAAVAAAPASDSNEVVLTVTARDLDGTAGHQRLMRRISLAAEELCGSYAAREQQDWDEVTTCRKAAFRSAEQQLAGLRAGATVRVAAR
jgi:UrcA family protein